MEGQLIRKPVWLRVRPPGGENYTKVKHSLRLRGLHTVCEEARCPNISECWGGGTATIMIMGDICSRGCRFCAVNSGKPNLLDPLEPQSVAEAVKEWALKYIVITSVCRDDLDDGGAEHFGKTIRAIKDICPKTKIESLIPDFRGNVDSLKKIINVRPEVISHNIETVRRLTPKIRDIRASYDQSLSVLRKCREIEPEIYTKSSIMLGLGESEEEIIDTLRDLRSVGVDIVTMGQYLQPSLQHLPVRDYLSLERFSSLKEIAERVGFDYVSSGPLVRSSYRAGEFFIEKIASKGVAHPNIKKV